MGGTANTLRYMDFMILFMELWLFFDVKIRKLSLKHQTQSYGFYILCCSTDFWKLLGDKNMIT